MRVVLTYDVLRRHSEVKRELLNRGFFDHWIYENETFYLPNTTLWHPDLPGPQEAYDLFINVIRGLNVGQPASNIIRIERLIAFEFTYWWGRLGDPHV